MRPLVASVGDPAGVGPQLLAQAFCDRAAQGLPPFAIVGSAQLMRGVAAHHGLAVDIAPIASLSDMDAAGDAMPVLDLGDVPYRPGHPDRDGASLALAALGEAARLTVTGEASALITGPIAKAALQDVGFAHPGQTEFVAEACGVPAEDAVMMLAGPSLRVVPLTVHVPLCEVPGRLSAALIEKRIAIAAAALTRDFGIAAPRIAVAGLNPHAGENGRMGDEEARIIAPAIAALREAGMTITGPHPGDAMFHAAARAGYDLAACMYHDQALIPLKVLDFDAGVNVTLGLPIVRTSPDHGTAFGIAGTDAAHAGPTIAAIRMAHECALRRLAA
ncbi:4-hydroxythreonine-4-phosphate dehydrogenase PdxA [Croceicoccus sp. YJ47]|uniref:4-hydroxythreonine-4-phosphate dehydrogenase PdxA n=1 Tax=Croceicoccus sp. YJ47 TaxID=2798724 RepID=UPI001921EF2C|nr:4-hydroxythreonine-4-phosphate dehydrogenase PdxA [Croceicoccus sp. YJ47]QQN73098.1 4-hydroxythreonine-4-phosphate dehydrogenase PdxA [Croceicoccus sp. YJ47]